MVGVYRHDRANMPTPCGSLASQFARRRFPSSATLPFDLPLHHAFFEVATQEHVSEDPGEAQYWEHIPDERLQLHPPAVGDGPVDQREAPATTMYVRARSVPRPDLGHGNQPTHGDRPT